MAAVLAAAALALGACGGGDDGDGTDAPRPGEQGRAHRAGQYLCDDSCYWRGGQGRTGQSFYQSRRCQVKDVLGMYVADLVRDDCQHFFIREAFDEG